MQFWSVYAKYELERGADSNEHLIYTITANANIVVIDTCWKMRFSLIEQ